MEPIQRICIDLDNRDISGLIKCLKILKKHDFTRDLEIKPSNSKTGYHVIAWHTGDGVTKEKLMRIREKAGCDPIQIMLDSRSNRQIQVMFDYKEKREMK